MTMRTLRVQDVLRDRILISRESARLLGEGLRVALADLMSGGADGDNPSVGIDFAGVEGVAPSFLDELLCVFESLLAAKPGAVARSLVVIHPPTRLSLKFEAVARGHGMLIRAQPDGSWFLQAGEVAGA